MKSHIILLLFISLNATLYAQKRAVEITIKDTAYRGGLSYPGELISNFNSPDSVTFHSNVDFHGSTFQSSPGFSNASFLGRINFTGTKFLSGANFEWSRFLSQVKFDSASFANSARFSSTEFFKYAEFQHAKFLKTANFTFAKFSKDVIFEHTEFLGATSFSNSRFLGFVYLLGAKFSEPADFSFTTFVGEVNFSSEFSKGLTLYGDTISKSIIFGSRFQRKSALNISNLNVKESGSLVFPDTVFPDTILFSGSTNLKAEIYFSEANFTDSERYDHSRQMARPIWIYLLNSNIAKIHLDYIHFKLLLPDSTILLYEYDRKRRLIAYDEKASIYEALLNNFKTNGQTDSYRLLDIEYQQFKLNNLWGGYLTWLPKYWWNFGYDKEYIFAWAFLFLLLFTCINYFFLYSLNTEVYSFENIPLNESWREKWSFLDFGNRVWYSFVYTFTIFFRLSLRIENLYLKHKVGTFYLIIIYSIGLVCLAYMANFVLQK